MSATRLLDDPIVDVEDVAEPTHLGEALHLMDLASQAQERVTARRKATDYRIEMIEDYFDQATASDRRFIEHARAILTEFARRRLGHLQPGDRKGFDSEAGRVSVRNPPDGYERDLGALLPWAAERGYVRVTQYVDWQRLKDDALAVGDHLVLNGEEVPTVRIVEREPSISVTFLTRSAAEEEDE